MEDIDSILLETESDMQKALDYLKSELKGVRTGRATPALIEFVKVEVYGAPVDLRTVAAINVPEPTQLAVSPFDPSTVQAIAKGIQDANLGLNPTVDGKMVRVNVPALSGDRRKQMVSSVKEMGEKAKISVRNVRRDANKHVEQLGKDKSLGLSEDDIKGGKNSVQDLLKKFEKEIEDSVSSKSKEIETV